MAKLSRDVLHVDPRAEADRISAFIREQVTRNYHRKGVVVGMSGGLDSAVVACLCVRALGPEAVLGLILPERESNPVSERFAWAQIEKLGIAGERIDLTPILEVLGTYREKDEVISRLCPSFDPARDTTKVKLPGDLLNRDSFNVFSLVVTKPDGAVSTHRLRASDFQALEAAQNMKTRSRMMQLYHRAEKMHRVVAGTTNRTELDEGFFVKYGDGGVDMEPLAHLYKTQVFQLGRHIGVTEEILNRMPSPDTWSGQVGDEEFYYRLPIETLDILLYAWNNGVPDEDVGAALGLSLEQIRRAYRDIDSKKRSTWHLRCVPPSILA
jgi:NAD+ synthase